MQILKEYLSSTPRFSTRHLQLIIPRFNGVVYQLKFSSEYKLVRDKMSCIFVRAEDEVVPQSLESFSDSQRKSDYYERSGYD